MQIYSAPLLGNLKIRSVTTNYLQQPHTYFDQVCLCVIPVYVHTHLFCEAIEPVTPLREQHHEDQGAFRTGQQLCRKVHGWVVQNLQQCRKHSAPLGFKKMNIM